MSNSFKITLLSTLAIVGLFFLTSRNLFLPRSCKPNFSSKEKYSLADKKSSKNPITILSTGDLMLGRSVNFKGKQQKDFSWSLQKITPELKKADLSLVQLESPIIANCPLTNEGMIFCADSQAAVALNRAGIDLATLANNHIFNYGGDGLQQTKAFLHQSQISPVDDQDLVIRKIGSTNFGFLAFDDISQSLDFTLLQNRVQTAASKVDVLIISLHWGREYHYQPTERQKTIAHLLIDSGAKIVLGNHSHWLGPMEKYQEGAIIYSHGNFIFDQMWSEETREGLISLWQFEDKDLQKLIIKPIWITDYGLANLATGERANKILQTVHELSDLQGFIEAEQLIIDF